MISHFKFSVIIYLTVGCASISSGFTTHTIQFGGIFGFAYSPNRMNVIVGDTVKWVGNFSQFSLQSTSVPANAQSFFVNSGDTFKYVITQPGEYDYQDSIYLSLGMKGSFTATTPTYGLTNEGKEFYLGMIYPSFNIVSPGQLALNFKVHALISTYYDSRVTLYYFDGNGKESLAKQTLIPAGSSADIILDISSMAVDTSSDAPAYKSCHIVSTQPVSVTYLSIGPSGGGSYLALPVLGLGRQYVTACFKDDAGNGALYDPRNSSYIPSKFDYAGGIFVIVGTEDGTNVTISPSVTTALGHPGANDGSPHPYKVQLNRGQCYQVRSNGQNEDNDLSESIITSDKPVAVISGHQNASIGGADPWQQEERDFMIEQMTPVEYWDNSGYVSIPLIEGIPPGEAGHGDLYRVYAFDSSTVKTQFDVQGISGGYQMSSKRLSLPAERSEITSPVEAYSLDGKKFAVMQYDERSQIKKDNPDPAPSMITIVPISRWKTSYSVAVPIMTSNPDYPSPFKPYFNIIGANLNNVSVSTNNGSVHFLSYFTKLAGYNTLSKSFSGINAGQYEISTSFISNTYRFSSSSPFIVYYYGMGSFTDLSSNTGDTSEFHWHYEYAAPAGMQLNTGVTPSFVVATQQTCTGWHVCITDTGANDPGVKAAILIDDPDGVYWSTPAKFSNVSFDQNSADYADGELHPHWHTNSQYCFDVNFTDPLSAAFAPMAIVDNLGNAIVLQLTRTAPTVKLSSFPIASSRPDSIVFPVKKIGDQICDTFTVKNTAAKGGTALHFTSSTLTSKDTSYKIVSITPSLPLSLSAGDSLKVSVCYTPPDSSRHQDSLIITSDCFSLGISLDAHGSTGLISANDIDFGTVTVGETICKIAQIKNIGSASFTLEANAILNDTINFSLDPASLVKLPAVIKPGGYALVNICFHPQAVGRDTGNVIWSTDLEPAFKHSVKDRTFFTGIASPKEGVSQTSESEFSIYPNPVSNIAAVTLPVHKEGELLRIYDVLGREMMKYETPAVQVQVTIRLGSLSGGVYYASFRGMMYRFVKQ